MKCVRFLKEKKVIVRSKLTQAGAVPTDIQNVPDSTLKRATIYPKRCIYKVKVTLRLTVSQSVCLGIEPHLGPMTRYLFLSDSYVLVSVGRPL
jgi:hypothetical protein